MATVNSLICWGGRTGKTVSILATTDVVTLTNHGLRTGTKLWPSGTLPAELSVLTPVYARYIDANTFALHTSAAGAVANTGQIVFSGSSTYAAVVLKSDLVASPSTALYAYGLSDLSRWGASGSERIYDGMSSWNSARTSAASSADEEVCELGEAFVDILPQSGTDGSYNVNINVPAAKTTIWSKINGIRTPAFHAGGLASGYALKSNYYGIRALKYNVKLDGWTFLGYLGGIAVLGQGGSASNMLVLGTNSGYEGVRVNSGNTIENCLIAGFGTGILLEAAAIYFGIFSNTVVKNTDGIKVYGGYESSTKGWYYNNISIGNTTSNWGTQAAADAARNNAGLAGQAWDTASSRITMSTSDFANWGSSTWAVTDNYRPASASSPQVDTGFDYLDASGIDVTGSERPNYNNGASEARDVGCYEFDHGYGPHPSSTTVTFDGVIAGSEIRVYDSALNELAGIESCATNQSLTWAIPSPPSVQIKIINVAYKIKDFTYVSVSGNQTIPIQQELDKWYSNP